MAECEVRFKKKKKRNGCRISKKSQNKDVRSQKKVKNRCPISPELEKGMTNLTKQTKYK